MTIFSVSLRLSWIESFNRGKHVIAAFLDVEKAFDNIWHNGLRYKIYQLGLPTKLCRRLSDFLVGRVIQVKTEGFLSPKVYPKAGVPQCSNLSPLRFLIYVNDMPNPSHYQTNKSQFADAGQWAVSKNIDLAAEYLQQDLDKLARWCAKWRIKLNPEKTKVGIFSKSQLAIRAEPALSLYGDLLSYYPHIEFLGIAFDNRMTFTKHFQANFRMLQQQISPAKDIGQQKVGSKSRNHFTNLQTMCKTNIRIWDCFYQNCFGIRHQQNSKSPELFH